MHSFQFNISGLYENRLTIPDARAGQYVMQDPSGKTVRLPETEYENAAGTGVAFDFSGITASGVWTARATVEDGVAAVLTDTFSFTADDLGPDRLLSVIGASIGDVMIFRLNGDRYILNEVDVTMPQGNGIQFDFNGIDMGDGLWHANYYPLSSPGTVIQYSSNGVDGWHQSYSELIDNYMRFSTDGGSTWSPAIPTGGGSGGGSSSSGGGSGGESSGGSSSSSGGTADSDYSDVDGSTEPYTAGYVTQYFRQKSTGNNVVDKVISLTVPHIWMFLEIQVNYELGARRRDGSYKFSYGNWNPVFEPEVFLNGSAQQLSPAAYTIDYEKGVLYPKYNTMPGDNLLCTYNFSWFRISTLASYVERSIGTINYHGQGATTSYTVDTLPESFYGISADLCVAMCCENLILGYTMWCGKLIFAISSNDLYNGGGDVASQLETIKRNAEDRAYGALDNENTRAPNMLKRPTPAYWRAVTMGTGIRPGPHGQLGYGKTRGIKYNKMVGMSGPDTGGVSDLGL